MPNMPLVSIVVPAYKAEQTLEKCVNSLTQQTYRNLEVVVVNDCSPDGTLALAQRLAAADGRVRVFSTPQNGGPSQARNFGIEQAKGEWIAFCDSDDYIEPQTFEAAVAAAQKNSADLVVWSYVSEYGEVKKEKHIFDGDRVMTNSEMFLCTLGPVGERLAHPEFIHSLSSTCTKLFSARLIKENRLMFYDLKKVGSEDLHFSVQYCAVCPAGKSVYLDRCFYHYIKGDGASVSGKYRPEYAGLIRNLNNELDRLCTGRDDAAQAHLAVNNRRALCLINIGLNEMAAADGGRARRKRLKKELCDPQTAQALRQLDYSFLPLKWKAFFLCARLQLVVPFYALLFAMQKLIATRD